VGFGVSCMKNDNDTRYDLMISLDEKACTVTLLQAWTPKYENQWKQN
jgi:hypothetical protein